MQVVSENQVEKILERTLKALSEMPFVTGVQGPGIESKKKTWLDVRPRKFEAGERP